MQRAGLGFLIGALGNVVRELGVLSKHWRGRWSCRKLRGRRDLKVNFGCGPKPKPDWVNIDLVGGADVTLDLRKPLPLDAGSCRFVYSEHFFEHLDYPDDAALHLRECLRILASGGVLRIGVPDAEQVLRWYASLESRELAEGVRFRAWRGHPDRVRTAMEKVNFLFRQNYEYRLQEHRFAYDFATLASNLRAAGFVEISRQPFDPSLDSADRMRGTLYVTAVRP